MSIFLKFRLTSKSFIHACHWRDEAVTTWVLLMAVDHTLPSVWTFGMTFIKFALKQIYLFDRLARLLLSMFSPMPTIPIFLRTHAYWAVCTPFDTMSCFFSFSPDPLQRKGENFQQKHSMSSQTSLFALWHFFLTRMEGFLLFGEERIIAAKTQWGQIRADVSLSVTLLFT